MDDDWDLHAVVRGCAAVNTTDDTFSNSPSLPINNIENSFDFLCFFDNKNDPFLGLHEIYQEFCVDPPPPAATISAVASPVAQGFQPHDQIPQTQPLPQMNKQRQEKNTSFPSPLSHTATNSQPFRQRRRRNQQTKMIREMTQEELAGDSWAWRKYGQKPIKGSPYPRNYYRCSTSKDCAARKQVERSVNDPTIFVVSYTGEHTHPRPIHRSSLAGSTRNRLGQNKNNNNTLCSLSIMGSLSSPASCSSFSSTTIGGEATEQNDDVEMEQEVEEENNERDYEEEDDNNNNNNNNMMINDLMNNDEDIFKRFQDSDDSNERDLFTSGVLLSPPWLLPENRDT